MTVEEAGFDGLYVADHLGAGPSPFVALAAAATVTEQIRLGTCVLNAGMWEPLPLASAIATLDVVSGGRAILGVGAGHTPQEWTATGRRYPSPGERVDRMAELIDTTRALLTQEVVSHQGTHFTLVDATLTEPRPVQDQVRLLVGGNGDRVLRIAAQEADIVGVTGLGRTLPDGHRHEVDWSPSTIRRLVDLIHSAGDAAGRHPSIEALVQHVEITDDASAAAARLAVHVPGASVDDLLTTPFVWLGTVQEIRDHLRGHATNLSITRFVVRESALAEAGLVLD